MNSVAKRALAALIVLATLVVAPAPGVGAAPVTCGGLVFEDYDADGERSEDYSFAFDTAAPSAAYDDVLDPGVAGVTATVTTASGSVETDTTNAAGEWAVTVDDADFPVRVEFSTLPTDWNPSSAGSDSGTLTQFIQNPADCANPSSGSGPDGNVGIVAPGTFCENRPEFLTSCFLFGNFADHDNQPAVVAVLDGSQDNNAETNWQSPAYTLQATLGQVGSVWGTGIDRTTGDTYVGSFVKRHTQLAGNPTTIYRITSGGAVAPWFTTDLSAVDPHTAAADAAALGLANPLDGWIYDYGAFDDVGVSGLGDVEVSVDGNTLYTVDLGQRELVAIPIQADGSPGTPTRTGITAGSLGISTCPDSDIRPFGLGLDESGLVHVGAVCSAESTVADPFTPIADTGPVLGNPTQLAAWVFTFDGSNFAMKTDVPVPTATRGSSVGGSALFAHQAQWRPWVDRMPYAPADITSYGNTYPQPIVSDIEFDGDDMIIGIMDRWGHQTGANAFYEDWSNATQPNGGFGSEQPVSSGDIVRAVFNGTDFDFPQSGPDYTYDNDNYGGSHSETSLGAMAQIPGRPYVVTASFDPNPAANTWQSGGLEWFDNATGDHVNGYRLYNGRPAGIDVGTFEKAAGIGDLEADCGTASIQVGNRVFFDTDDDGVQDPDEAGMAGITIELLNAAGTVIDTVVTDADGQWVFDDVAPNTDRTARIAQSNYDAGGVFAPGGAHEGRGAITIPDAGSDDGNDADATLADGLPSISFNVNTSNHTLDFGMVVAGTLRVGNRVWLDEDANGSQNGTEPGIDGVEVQLWSANAAGDPVALLATDTTAGDGFYVFEALYAGDYVLAIADTQQVAGQQLAGLASTSGNGSAPDPDDGVELDDNGDPAVGFASISEAITLSVGGEPTDDLDEGGWVDDDSNLTVDFGFIERLRLGNLVFEDLNSDGDADVGEPGIADVSVQLWSVDGAGDRDTMLAIDITDANGFYEFAGLEPGDYIVAISDGEQVVGNELHRLVSTSGNGIAPDADINATDSDDNGEPSTGFASITAPVTLVGGTEPAGEVDEDGTYADNRSNLTVDLGFVRTYRLGNLVWFDANNNGVADAGETPIAGVEVQLWSTDGAGAPLAELDSVDTDANGRYVFEDLAAGDYVVAIPSAEQGTGESLNGLVSSLGATVAPGPDNGTDNDDNGTPATGFAAISPAVTIDASAPLVETDGLVGGVDEDGNWPDAASDLSVDFGFVGALRLGNRVWLDQDGNGSQNGTEPGIEGVEVQLWSVDGAGVPVAVIATDTTAGGGFYVFENLAPRDYVVAIADTQQAAGEALEGLGSTLGSSAPNLDSDLDDSGDPAPGFASISSSVTLAEGVEPGGEADEAGWVDTDSNLTVDFGFVAGVEIGNLVWFDANNDGNVDAGEPAISGVTVQLLDVNGVVIGSTVTDVDGHYVFTGIAPGQYIVEIPASEFAAGAPLANHYPSDGPFVSGNPNDDTDNNSDGSPSRASAAPVQSGTITVAEGSEPTDEVDESPTATADAASNLSIDFGFYNVSIGDLVWFDDDNNGVRNGTEAPGVGVVLNLLDENNQPVLGADGQPLTTVTDSNGQYRFDGLQEGSYVVEIPASQFEPGAPLAGRASSSGNDVNGTAPDPDDDTDSDDNGDFYFGGVTRTKPIAVSAGDEPGVSDNPTVDLGFTPAAGLGTYVWVDTDRDGAQDPSEPGVPGVVVTVFDAETGAVVAIEVTDANGGWSVTGLPPGTYYVEFSDPAGRTFTPADANTNDGIDSDAGNGGRTGVVVLGIGEYNPTIDAGIVSQTTTITSRLPDTGSELLNYLALAGLFMASGCALLMARRMQTSPRS